MVIFRFVDLLVKLYGRVSSSGGDVRTRRVTRNIGSEGRAGKRRNLTRDPVTTARVFDVAEGLQFTVKLRFSAGLPFTRGEAVVGAARHAFVEAFGVVHPCAVAVRTFRRV